MAATYIQLQVFFTTVLWATTENVPITVNSIKLIFAVMAIKAMVPTMQTVVKSAMMETL